MFLSHEALHHADAVQVFPDYAVEAVIGLEHAAEYGVRYAGDDHETAEEDGNDDQVEEPYLPVRRKSHDEGADDGDGCLCGHAQYHHDGVLHVHDVRRHARDEAVGGEFVDVRKGKVLDAPEHPVPQVPGGPAAARVELRPATVPSTRHNSAKSSSRRP